MWGEDDEVEYVGADDEQRPCCQMMSRVILNSFLI
jgi:hypothetical protein